jgi:anti-sigma B factor antagonist
MSEDRDINERNHARIAVENMPSADNRGEDRALAKPDGQPHLRVLTLERTALVRFVDTDILIEEVAVRSVGDQLDRLIEEEGYTQLLLSFHKVRYLSSAALDRLARLQKKVDRVHGRIQLCRLDPLLRDMLRVTHMDKVFDVYADEVEALGLVFYL